MISIHAPYKRVRLRITGQRFTIHGYFNPRTLQESATGIAMHQPTTYEISIHAPYKRVRQTTLMIICCGSYFNPRTLQESATYDGCHFELRDSIFQSTHPTRECDASWPKTIKTKGDFNPRTLQESATDNFVPYGQSFLFQSTHPTRECDVTNELTRLLTTVISIHAPYKRVRHH